MHKRRWIQFAYVYWHPGGLGEHPAKGCSKQSNWAPASSYNSTSFQFKSGLEFHPDRAWVSWLLYGIKYGVKIGYNSLQSPIKSKNLPSAYEYPHIIDAELTKERAAGRILGPFTSPPFPTLYCSGLGVVPNKNGKWRMIMHLSAPVGQSIID